MRDSKDSKESSLEGKLLLTEPIISLNFHQKNQKAGTKLKPILKRETTGNTKGK